MKKLQITVAFALALSAWAYSAHALASWNKRVLAAENSGDLITMIKGLEAKKSRTALESCALANAITVQENLETNGLSTSQQRWSARKIYNELRRAMNAESNRAFPVTTLYLWIQSHEYSLGFGGQVKIGERPYKVTDAHGHVVDQGTVPLYDTDPAEKKELADLYQEMTRREANDPYVLYIGAGRTDAKHRLDYLDQCEANGGRELFDISLLDSRYMTYLELGDKQREKATLADLRDAILQRKGSIAVRLYLRRSVIRSALGM
jgi:hypothetical protein